MHSLRECPPCGNYLYKKVVAVCIHHIREYGPCFSRIILRGHFSPLLFHGVTFQMPVWYLVSFFPIRISVVNLVLNLKLLRNLSSVLIIQILSKKCSTMAPFSSLTRHLARRSPVKIAISQPFCLFYLTIGSLCA